MKRPTTAIVACELAALAWGAAVVPLAVLVLLSASTPAGRLFGLAGIAVGAAPFLGAIGWDRESQLAKRMAEVLLAFFAVTTVILLLRAPAARGTAATAVQVLSPGAGKGGFPAAVGELLPEVDQLQLGFAVMAALDSQFTLHQAVRLKAWTTEIYREMAQDARFRGLGSALPAAYAELAGWNVEGEHAFLYVPPGLDRTKPTAALVFLHGSGGNFKAYLWLLSRLADRLNLVVIAPTFGCGNWRTPETSRVVGAALAAAGRVVRLDPANLHLMGLSNGGLGVTQLTDTPGSAYRSIVFLSPVFGVRRTQNPAAVQAWRDRPVLVLSGRDDDRVPAAYVEQQATGIARAGAAVTVEFVDGADHFLFFSHREQVTGRLEAWLRQNGVAGAVGSETGK